MTDWLSLLVGVLAGIPGWIALHRDRPERKKPPKGRHRK